MGVYFMANPFLITENFKGKPTNIFAEVYPDSAPEDWLEILRDLKIPFCVSPLHYKDIGGFTLVVFGYQKRICHEIHPHLAKLYPNFDKMSILTS